MSEQRIQRRLAAILVADVVGYSRLIEADEDGTRARLRALQSELVDPEIAAHGGRIVKTVGDGVLVEFASAVDAVRCALAVQAAMGRRNADETEARKIVFRIGINLGDVIVEDEDLHGDGVNVAARLEGLCEPGEVFVSASVHEQVVGKIDAGFDDLGAQTVKNISRPIRVFRARPASSHEQGDRNPVCERPLPAKTSIAVLPFRNLAADPAQDYLVEGLRLAIQGVFVHNPRLFLLAPGAVAEYEGQQADPGRVSREKGVRYVLEGAVQATGGRIRVMVQLTDGAAGRIIWAERYDRELADILAVQDEIALAVVSALDAKFISGEPMQAHLDSLTSVDALSAYYRGLSRYYVRSRENNAAAIREFEKLHAMEPESPIAPAYLSMCHWLNASMGWSGQKNRSLLQAVDWAEKAVGYEETNGLAHIVLACVHLLNRRHDAALATCYQALERRPTCPTSYITLASVLHYCGHAAEAVPKAKTAMRIMDVFPPWFLTLLAASYRDAGEIDRSIAAAMQALELSPNDVETLLVLCSDLEIAGATAQAQDVARQILEIDPDFSLSTYARTQHYRDTAILQNLIDHLEHAGLPP